MPAGTFISSRNVGRPTDPRRVLHIQMVNSCHSRIKGFLQGFCGIATKYLESRLRWLHLIEPGGQPSPRARIMTAMAMPAVGELSQDARRAQSV